MSMQIEIGQDRYLSPESTRFLQTRGRLVRFCQLNGCKYREEDLRQPTHDRGPYQTTQHNSGALSPDTQPAEVAPLEPTEPEDEEDLVEGEEEAAEEDETGEVVDNYDDEEAWSFTDLKQELRRRELPQNGNRKALIGRLREDDARVEEE